MVKKLIGVDDMKKIIIALIAVVLVLTGGFIFLKSGDNNEVVNP